MTRPPVLRALLALLILGLSAFYAITQEPRLGLDLRGGTSITLETSDSPTTQADAEATDRAVEVLRRRVDALGVSEPTLARSGENRIIVELPGVQDSAAAAEAVGQTAQLTFHPVLGPGDPTQVVGRQAPPAPLLTAVPTPAPAATAAPSAAATPAPSAQPSAAPSQGRAVPDLPGDVLAAPSPTAAPSAAPSAAPAPSATPSAGASAAPEVGEDAEFDPTAEQTVLDDTDQPIRLGPASLTGEDVEDAAATVDTQTGTSRIVNIDFKGEGGRKWEQLTAQAACAQPGDPTRRVAIVLDGEVISSPQVQETVQCNVGIQGGTTTITGDFSQEEADQLAVLIKGGALPVPVTIIASSTVGPTLGQEAIDASVEAGIIGLSLTAIFLVVVYRFVGVLAAVALASYGLISYGALVALGATLTLPGLGGLLLSAGLAIDANVLVFERAREEYAASRSKRLMPALDNGFSKAFSAIADSNVTTLLAAGLLFFLAAGPVRGFGVTLVIGVLASVISALLVTRVLTDFGLRRGLVSRRPGITGLATLGRFRTWLEAKRPDLMQHTKLYFGITAAVLVLAVLGMLVRGFNFGLEFTGGRVVEFTTSQELSVADARSAVEDAGFPTAVVQETGENVSVRTTDISEQEVEEIRTALAATAGEVTVASNELIGPTLGDELRNKALIALVIALLAQLAYLAFRFRWTMAAGTVLAMLHDVVLVVGLFAWLGKPIDGVFLAAALTIIGVSVNDSVVTMDRIRETWSLHRSRPLPQVANDAIIATAPRTINTGLGAFFILGALTLLGGRSLTDFALALLVGLFVGTYSSAFLAVPLTLLFERRNSAPPPMPKRRAAPTTTRRPAASRRRPPAPRPARVSREGGATT
jgi:SecD/SecF fusion protein